jgi:hypothetical protein
MHSIVFDGGMRFFYGPHLGQSISLKERDGGGG